MRKQQRLRRRKDHGVFENGKKYGDFPPSKGRKARRRDRIMQILEAMYGLEFRFRSVTEIKGNLFACGTKAKRDMNLGLQQR